MRFFFALLLLMMAALSRAEFFFQLDSESYSESLAVHEIYQGEPSFVEEGELIYSNSLIELGYRFDHNFSVSLFQRFDGIVQHSPDTAFIFFLSKADASDIPERDYAFYLEANTFSSQGVSFQWRYHPAEWFAVSFDTQVGQTRSLMLGEISGLLTYKDEQLSSGDAVIDYAYERDVLFERETAIPKGLQTAIAVNLFIRSVYGIHELQIDDAYHQVKWRSAPRTQASLDTDRITEVDESGKLEVNPLGSGREFFSDITQTLPARYYFKNSIFLNDKYQLLMDVNFIADEYWPILGMGMNLEHHQLQFRYSQRDNAARVNWNYKQWLSLYMGITNINLRKSHRVDLGWRVSFF